MKKEIESKVSEFIRRESNLIVALNKKTTDSKSRADLLKLRHEIMTWLNELGGRKTITRAEDGAALDQLVHNAASDMSHTAKINAQLVEFIEQSIKTREDWSDYDRVVEDYGQLEALAQMRANKSVKALEKFNKKLNGKSFLNVLMCKFKKSKAQESERSAESVEIEK